MGFRLDVEAIAVVDGVVVFVEVFDCRFVLFVRLFEPPNSEGSGAGSVALDYEAGVLGEREIFRVDA